MGKGRALGLCKAEVEASSCTTLTHPGLAQHLALASLLEARVLAQFYVEGVKIDPVLGRSSLRLSGRLRGDSFKAFSCQDDPVPALKQVWQPECYLLHVEQVAERTALRETLALASEPGSKSRGSSSERGKVQSSKPNPSPGGRLVTQPSY